MKEAIKTQRKTDGPMLTVLWLAALVVYGMEILAINFSGNPQFYNADMYADLMYAVAAWKDKTIFPDGWVFGNQYYVVATPVLAALMFGITEDPCTAMGLASTCMGIGVLLSFEWMLKVVFPKFHQRLAAMVILMTMVLACGDAAHTTNGWQLFFTMCSYYACYAITAFLAFGCYLRRCDTWSAGTWLAAVLACLLSFATGIQSLRQTAVMVIPLLALTVAEQGQRLVFKKRISVRSVALTGSVTLSNLCGVLYAGTVPAQKHEIFGTLSVTPVTDAISALSRMLGLFGACWILGLAATLSAMYIMGRREKQDRKVRCLLLLCLVSSGVILALDLFTAMNIRPIYYFLLYPMAAVSAVYWYTKSRRSKYLMVVGLLMMSLISCGRILPLLQRDQPLQQVSDCLEENNVTVVYTQWNLGAQIAVASDFKIRVGFWDSAGDVFRSVKYLCDPAVFCADPKECAYLVSGVENLALALARAGNKGAEVTILESFPEWNLYLLGSDKVLMD